MKKLAAFTLMLALIMSFGVFSFADGDCIDTLDFEFSDDYVTIENVTVPYMIIGQTVKDCTSLTYNYWVSDEGTGRWVVYYKYGNGEWHRGKDFTIDKDEPVGSVKIEFVKPITFDKLAIFKISRYGFNFTYYYVGLTDVCCKNSAAAPKAPAKTPAPSKDSSGSAGSSYEDINFEFGDSTEIMGTSTHPVIFERKIKNCKSFSFDYRITDDSGAGRWVAYYKNGSSDSWHKLKDFVIDEDHLEGSEKMSFPSATTFDRLAICKTSRYGFSYSVYMGFSDFNCY